MLLRLKNPETELVQKMGNNGDHRKQEVIEYYSKSFKLLKQVNDALRQVLKAMKRFHEAIPKEIKRKGKFRQN